MKKHIFIYIFLSLFVSRTLAQESAHLNLWGRASVAYLHGKKWKYEAEIQHRTQNDFPANERNVLAHNLLNSIRTWAHFQYNEALSLSLSPFAYYWHNRILIAEADKNSRTIQELRFSAALDAKHELTEKLWLMNRTCMEYRDFQNTTTDITRLRIRIGLRYELTEKLNLVLYEELFLNLKGAERTHIFDHERIAFLINYRILEQLRLETGYMYISRLPRNTDEFLHENNFIVHVYYTLKGKQHEKQNAGKHS